jgi:hypothetical protein
MAPTHDTPPQLNRPTFERHDPRDQDRETDASAHGGTYRRAVAHNNRMANAWAAWTASLLGVGALWVVSSAVTAGWVRIVVSVVAALLYGSVGCLGLRWIVRQDAR